MILKAFVGIFIGVLLASVIILPTALHVMGSGRSGVSIHIEKNLGSIIAVTLEYLRELVMPKISECIPGAFSFSATSSTAAFIPVVGLLPILGLMMYRREMKQFKWLWVLLMSLLIVYLTPLNSIFSLFTNSWYTRWLYGFDLLLGLAFVSFISREQISRSLFRKYVVLSGLIVVALLVFVGYTRLHNLTINRREIIELSLYVLNLLMLGVYVYRKQSNNVLILFISISAVLNFAFTTYTYFKGKESKGPLTTYVLEDTLSYNDSNFVYRTDFYSDYRNNGLLKNRPSVMCFHSISNKQFNDLRRLISDELSCPTMFVRHNRTTLDALMSVKEYYDYNRELSGYYIAQIDSDAIELDESAALYKRYRFKYYIPMGFCYDSYVTRGEFEEYLATHPVDSVMPMLEHLVINGEDVPMVSDLLSHGQITRDARLDSVVGQRRQNVATQFEGDTRGLKMKTDFDSDRVVFLSVVHDPGFTATIDGVATPIINVNLGLSAIRVPQGHHEIDFDYTPPGLRLGSILSLLALILLGSLAYLERHKHRLHPKRE